LIKNISDKDKKDWNEFLNKKEKLIDKDTVFIKNKVSKTKIIDLHGYTLEEANKKVESIIEKSFKENISKIKIITGKGLHSQNEKNPYVSKDLSILKYSVPEFILNNTSLMKKIIEIKDAEVEDGGSGVFYVILKKIIK
jgi:DNA-nicking Smr family endonuclease